MTYTEVQQEKKRDHKSTVKPYSTSHAESIKQVLRTTPQRQQSLQKSTPFPAPVKAQEINNERSMDESKLPLEALNP